MNMKMVLRGSDAEKPLCSLACSSNGWGIWDMAKRKTIEFSRPLEMKYWRYRVQNSGLARNPWLISKRAESRITAVGGCYVESPSHSLFPTTAARA